MTPTYEQAREVLERRVELAPSGLLSRAIEVVLARLDQAGQTGSAPSAVEWAVQWVDLETGAVVEAPGADDTYSTRAPAELVAGAFPDAQLVARPVLYGPWSVRS